MAAISTSAIPSETQLTFPLLDALHANGGAAKPGVIYDEIAKRLGLSDEIRNATVDMKTTKNVNLFERRVRWTRQRAVMHGLISRETRGKWELTDKANVKLGNIVRGAILLAFETNGGYMLHASAEDALSVIERNSCQLIFTSPPYPLCKVKAYQVTDRKSASEWTTWMLRLAEQWRELITDTGSIMINIGRVWEPGIPRASTYVERFLIKLEDELGLFACQHLSWESKTKLPSPLQWVGIDRVRVKDTIEPILWVSPAPEKVAANNRRVLKPYSEGMMRAMKNPADGVHQRPSGYVFGPSSFVDNGGAIPSANIQASNADSNSAYHRAERAAGRKSHPATMPPTVAAFAIKLATTEDDLVYDPFGGSGVTGIEAEKLKRRWIMSERSREYIESARIRFTANGLPPRVLTAA